MYSLKKGVLLEGVTFITRKLVYYNKRFAAFSYCWIQYGLYAIRTIYKKGFSRITFADFYPPPPISHILL